jgi:GST-like protein
MIKFYYHPSPNPAKVALFLEEAGLEYESVPVDTRKGEQHSSNYRSINPNAKTPAIVDGEATIFDSSAILLYLAEKTKRFLPENTPKARGELLSWLFFVSSGVGPYSGQSFHFNVAAPEKIEYAINRYNFETHRHWKILDDRLAGRKYVLGDVYTIVDMSVWGWSSAAPYLLGAETWSKMANVKRLVDEINERPAVARVNKLKEKHAFKQSSTTRPSGICSRIRRERQANFGLAPAS